MNREMESRLVNLIKEAVSPDMIFVLGITRNNRFIESIFSQDVCRSEFISAYFLLVLARQDVDTTIVKCQERIEQLCQAIVSTTCLLVDTGIFNQWLYEGHGFAKAVVSSIEPIYKAENICLGPIGENNSEIEKKKRETHYREGLSRSQEFIAGAELFRIRKQYKLAMFMLHQSVEQVLGTMVKIGMGYYCCTHSIDRLLRYAGFVFAEIHEIFPRNNEVEKRLFLLLQKAYIDSRYGVDYSVGYIDLDDVTKRVKTLYDIFVSEGGKYLEQKITFD